MRNIMVTDYDNEANVAIFTETLTVEEVKKRLEKKGDKYSDIFEVPDDDLQHYCYEPTWLES